MKKLLAVLLSVFMIASMSTVAMAAGEGTEGTEPPIVISTEPSGQMIYGINTEYGYYFTYRENSPITGVRFENGRMEAVYKDGQAKVKLIDPDYSRLENYCPVPGDESFQDTMIFSFEDGKEFSYPISFTSLYPEIGIKWTSTGTWEEGDSFIPSSDRWAPLGGTATYHAGIIDKLGLAVPPFQFKVTSETTSQNILDGVEKHFEISVITTDEQTGDLTFKVTNLITPEMIDNYYHAIEQINVEISDSTGKQFRQATCGIRQIVDTFHQPPEGFQPDKPTTPTDPDKPTDPTDPEDPSKPTDPENPDKPADPEKPDKPTTPDKPTKPTTPADPTETKESPREAERSGNVAAEEAAVDAVEAANDGKTGKVQSYTTAAGTSVSAVPVKLYGLNASLSVDTMETIAAGKTGLNVNLDNGAAGVLIPAGFPMPSTTGVLGYSLGWQKDPLYANLMKAAVKDDNAKTEVYKLGAGTLPTTATVTLKTKLTGKVNVYLWDEATRKATLVATVAADGGKVTFATKRLGNFVITTGAI